jgi:hypothetical protein
MLSSVTSCVTVKQQEITEDQELIDREKIISKALEIESINLKPAYRQRITLKHPLTGEDMVCMMDCSGLVSCVFRSANISGFKTLTNNVEGENGVKIIYKALERSKKIYRKKIPNVADIIFFDNTYDRDKNEKVNEELTHVGIVLSIDNNGTITFIRSSVSGGVTRDYVNLYHSDKETLKERRLIPSFVYRKIPIRRIPSIWQGRFFMRSERYSMPRKQERIFERRYFRNFVFFGLFW